MSKVIEICGKVGAGKTYYAKKIMEKQKAVLLSNDELLHYVFPNTHPNNEQELMTNINMYLVKKGAEIVNNGCDVILDWGFWKKEERKQLTQYFQERNISTLWYYVSVDDETWKKNIETRNKEVKEQDDGSSFPLNEEILDRANKLFEVPSQDENMIIIKVNE